MFGGYYANAGTYPKWIFWFQYLSPTRCGLEALVRNEFENRNYAEGVPNPLEYLNFKVGLTWCVLVLLGFALIFRSFSILALKRIVRQTY